MPRALVMGLALVIGVAALAPRFAVLPHVFTARGLIFPESDPFYHARRILLTLQHFPSVNQFDGYANFPEGARIYWPVGFDLGMAALGAAFAGLGDGDGALRACAVAVPFLALLGIAATGLLGRRLGGPVAGLAAAAMLAIDPQEVAYSIVGRVDHHVLEPFFLAATLLAFLRAAAAEDPRARDRWAVLCGAVMALAFWFITTAILIPAFLAAGIVLARVLEAVRLAEEKRLGRPGVIAFLSAALLLIPLVLQSSFGRAGEFSYLGLSWFQESVVILAGLTVAAAYWVLAPALRPARLAGLTAAAMAVVLLPVLGRLGAGEGIQESLGAIRDAGSFLFRTDPLVPTVRESQSPLNLGFFELLWSFTPWLLWTPVVWARLIAREGRKRFPDTGMILLLALFPLALAFLLLQIRFGILLGVPLALLAGCAIDEAIGALRARRLRWVDGVALALAVVTVPMAAYAVLPAHLADLRGVSDPAVDAYVWIRDHTPPTRGFDDPVVKPEYGIVCSWDQGHVLTYFSRRPNIANPFGQAPWHIRGALRASGILIEESAERAAALCDELSARYLVLQTTRGEIFSAAEVAKGMDNAYAKEVRDEHGDKILTILPPYFETLHARLALFDGAAIPGRSGVLPVVTGFRLVYESPEAGEFPVGVRGQAQPIVPRLVKVFERVHGAALEGSCEAGKPVEAFVQVQTNIGRRFVYSTAAPCGASGRFEMRVPYAQSVTGDTGALGKYLLRNAARQTSVLVTESDVEEGRRISVGGWGA